MSKNSPHFVVYIIWVAMLFSQLVYLSIPFFVEMAAQEIDDIVLIMFGGIGVITPLAGIFAVPKFMPDPSNPNEFHVTRFIVQVACAEVPAVMGFASALLGADPILQYSLAAIGVMALLSISPFFAKRL